MFDPVTSVLDAVVGKGIDVCFDLLKDPAGSFSKIREAHVGEAAFEAELALRRQLERLERDLAGARERLKSTLTPREAASLLERLALLRHVQPAACLE
jgi:hypothetical protein